MMCSLIFYILSDRKNSVWTYRKSTASILPEEFSYFVPFVFIYFDETALIS